MVDSVFISYSGERHLRRSLHESLREHGLKPWRDVEHLDLGDDITPDIEAELENCGGAILWISEKLLASDYVRKVELPAIARAKKERNISIAPIFQGLNPSQASERVSRISGLEIGDNQGHVLDSNNPAEIEAELIADAYVRGHIKRFAGDQRPVVRAVTRDDVAAAKDTAILNFDWRHHFLRGDMPDPGIEKRLSGALDRSTRYLKDAFDPGPIDLALKTHLHLAVAFGHAFRRPTGFVPRMQVGEETWEASIERSETQLLRVTELQPGPVSSDFASLEVAITRSTEKGVNEVVASTGRRYRRRTQMSPVGGFGQTSVPGSLIANAWARQVGDTIAEMMEAPGLQELDLFIAAPVELAVLIGWWLNAAGVIHLHHWLGNQGPYVRAWTLPKV